MMENYKSATMLALAVLCGAALHAQMPAKCFEIESILVDACVSEADCPGSSEGMNEMVRFITGPVPVAVSDLQFEFFSSSFQGISQNAATATLTDQLNATVQGCGHLLEPPGGIIPPGSRVIFVTSTAMCVQANSFLALNDTLYIIFQNAGNSQGHFKNNSLVLQPVTPTPDAPLLRWLRMSLTSTGCGDTATYDANRLVNIYGSYGGNTEENDGATALFSWPGQPVATYVNLGCQAPFTPIVPTVVSGGGPIACGSSANLVGSVTGDYASVHWQGGGGAFSDPNAMSTSYTPGGGDNGDVQLSFCAITACNDTICTQVIVTTGATPLVSVSGDTTLCSQFDTSVLTASGADTYLWSTGATGPSIVAEISGPMNYWVVGTNACGSDTGYIAPRWMHATTYYENVSCNGAADGTLLGEGSGGVPPYSYLWSTGSTDSLITGLAPGYYSYTVTDADGCVKNGGSTITEPPLLTATVGADTTICPGGTAILQAYGAGGSAGSLGTYYYTWSPEGPVVSPAETTVYTVVVRDLAGCEAPPLQVTVTVSSGLAVAITGDTNLCASSETTLLTASGADAYLWSTGATGPSIVADITGPPSYWVAGTNGCGSDTAFVAPGWMQLNIANEGVSCAGAADGALAMQGSHGVLPYSFTWSTGSTDSLVSGLAPGTYSYTMEDAEGCTISGFATITEPPVLTVAVGSDTTICPGAQAVLSAQGAGGTPGYSYAWSPEGPVVSPAETTVYAVVVTDDHGCQTAPAQVTVQVTGQEAVITSTPLAGCAPHCITFTATSSALNSYQWDFGDDSTATDSMVQHCYADAGEYTVNVVVDHPGGCPSTTTTLGPFVISETPVADFSWAAPAIGEMDVQFNDHSSGATAWAWHFGDPAGSTSSDPSPAYTFPDTGCYPVLLVVLNDAGCADSTVKQVCIMGVDTLVLPNVFSPNGDGVNDFFQVSGGQLTTLDVKIFNRWGQQVAWIERTGQVWDGRSPAGEVLSEGTYFYTLHAVSASGKNYDLNGTVTLLR